MLVDLPGYGFAVGSEAERRGWGPLVESYLRERPTLRGVALLVDVRRGLEAEENELLALPRATSGCRLPWSRPSSTSSAAAPAGRALAALAGAVVDDGARGRLLGAHRRGADALWRAGARLARGAGTRGARLVSAGPSGIRAGTAMDRDAAIGIFDSGRRAASPSSTPSSSALPRRAPDLPRRHRSLPRTAPSRPRRSRATPRERRLPGRAAASSCWWSPATPRPPSALERAARRASTVPVIGVIEPGVAGGGPGARATDASA